MGEGVVRQRELKLAAARHWPQRLKLIGRRCPPEAFSWRLIRDRLRTSAASTRLILEAAGKLCRTVNVRELTHR